MFCKQNSMDSFLKSHKTLESKNATHLSLIGGKYHIPYDDMDMFHSLYVNNHKAMYLVERVRYPCYLFMDLDNTNISLVLSFLFNPQCYISSREDTEGNQTGFHIVFKYIIVNDPNHAIQEARSMIQDKSLDVSVYKTGLRMLGSHKHYKIERIYNPFPFTNEPITVQQMRDHSFIIQNKSLNLPSPSTPTKQISCVGNYYDFSRIHPEYKEIYVVKVIRKDRHMLIQTYEKFCTNIDRKHKNNHIYFVITETKMTQKCFCQCDHTQCKEYASPLVPTPIKLYYNLLNHL